MVIGEVPAGGKDSSISTASATDCATALMLVAVVIALLPRAALMAEKSSSMV